MKRREFIKNTLLTSAALLPACGSREASGSRGKMKVVLIGVDGAGWDTLEPLFAKGKLPFWKQLRDNSAWASLQTFKPTKSSVVWTSIATGTTMQKHGILDFTFLNKNNMEVPYSNIERREPAIWQILDEFKKKSIVVNWFVSHPPDKIDGIMISDNYRRVVARQEKKTDEYLDSVHPSIYFHKLLKFANVSYPEMIQTHHMPDYPELYGQLHPGEDYKTVPILKNFRSLAVQDHFVSEISNELFRTKEFDLFATYVRMPDLVQHFSGRMFDAAYTEKLNNLLRNDALTPEDRREAMSKIADIIEPAYTFSENLMKTLMTYKKYEDAYFIICSDHGFTLYPGGYNHYALPDSYEAPPGILMMKGPSVVKGKLEKASVLDIAPTILHLFDLPLGKNMDGRPLQKAFNLTRKQRYQLYKIGKSQQRKNSSADQAALDELKTIGYIN